MGLAISQISGVAMLFVLQTKAINTTRVGANY